MEIFFFGYIVYIIYDIDVQSSRNCRDPQLINGSVFAEPFRKPLNSELQITNNLALSTANTANTLYKHITGQMTMEALDSQFV